MGVQFIFSKETANKHETIAKETAHWLQQDERNEVFYIVPEHIKFDAELNMIRLVEEQSGQQQHTATMRFQVFSFSRLAWYFLKDTSVYKTKKTVSTTGLGMLVKKILLQHKEEFVLFRNEAFHKGFLEQSVTLFQELRQGNIEPEDFMKASESMQEGADYTARLHEFALLYRYFLKEASAISLEQDELLKQLCSELEQRDLSCAKIIIDDFYHFKSQEMTLIATLAQRAHQVQLHMTMTLEYIQYHHPNHQSLFYSNGLVIDELTRYLKASHIEIEAIRDISKPKRAFCEDIVNVEQYWLATTYADVPGKPVFPVDSLHHVHISRYETKQQELREVVSKMAELVQNGQYRMKDMLLLSRDLEADQLLLEGLFKEFQLAYFIDQSETLQAHPLLAMIEALFAIKKYYWRYSDVMTLLKSEYCLWPTALQLDDLTKELNEFRHLLDQSENIVLANGYEGSYWEKKPKWSYVEEALDEDEANRMLSDQQQAVVNAQKLRDQLVDILLPFFEKLNAASTTKEALTYLYETLEHLSVDRGLLYWRDFFASQGEVTFAKRQDQVWNEWNRLCDEFVLLFGEEPFDEESFLQIIRSGFEQTTYSMPPTTLDQIVCTGMDSIRFGNRRVAFLVGMDHTTFPSFATSESLLSEEERDCIRPFLDSGRHLKPSSSQIQSFEPFVFYKALTAATDELFISYHQMRQNGEALKLSPYVERICDQFKLEVGDGNHQYHQRVREFQFYSIHEWFTAVATAIRASIYPSHQKKKEWNVLAGVLQQSERWGEVYQDFTKQLVRKNNPTSIPQPLAQQLYGQDVYLSVSQVELFFKDPFSHFLRYGLRLSERKEFELSSANAGEYFHLALDSIIKELLHANCTLSTIETSELHVMMKRVFEQQNEMDQFVILSSSRRMSFIRELLEETTVQTILAMHEQAKLLNSTIYQTEHVFGYRNEPFAHLSIDENRSIHIRGRIDRMDTLAHEDDLYVSVVDYKSSKKQLDMNHVYAGVQLQLLTYLEVAKRFIQIEQRKKIRPFGAFYLHVHDPVLKNDRKQNTLRHEKWLKEYKYKGLVLNDGDILRSAIAEENDAVFPVRLTKSKTIHGQDIKQTVSNEQMDILGAFVMEKMKEAGRRILSGDISLIPLADDPYIPSVKGEYASISQFDVLNPENTYRQLPKNNTDEILEKMKEYIEEKGEEHERNS